MGKERGEDYFQKCASGLVFKKRKCIFMLEAGEFQALFPFSKEALF